MLLREKIAFKKSKIEFSKFRRSDNTLRIRFTQHVAFCVAGLSNVLQKWDVCLGKVACLLGGSRGMNGRAPDLHLL